MLLASHVNALTAPIPLARLNVCNFDMEVIKMARVYGIKKRLDQNSIAKEIIKEILENEDLVDIVIKMESKLDPEITYSILDSCACGISLKN